MHLALRQARLARDTVPVGAVLVSGSGNVLAASHNISNRFVDPTSHAEMEVIRMAARDGHGWQLSRATLFVTLEPCLMCAGAILNSRIQRVVFAAWATPTHPLHSTTEILRAFNRKHPVEVRPGVLEPEASLILKEFFSDLRHI